MAITSLTLTNPGFETANTTGWTTRIGSYSAFSAKTQAANPLGKPTHSGTYLLLADTFNNGSSVLEFDTTVDVSAYSTAIDANTAAAKGSGWLITSTSVGSCYLAFYAADGITLLGDARGTNISSTSTYTQVSCVSALPVGTRFIRLGGHLERTGTSGLSNWDDFALEIGDARTTDYPSNHFAPITTQVVAYAVGGQVADESRAEQAVVLVAAAGNTPDATYPVYQQQFVAYALVKRNGDKRKLRAWTFPQDEHKFYVLQLGNSNGTLVYDTLTQQWARWQSPTEVYWRGEDGCDWEGFNVCCDTLSGKIFQIDAEGRLDYNDTTDADDTPVTSIITGGMTKRMRTNTPCYMAELAISEGQPPAGFDETTVGISMTTTDTQVTYDHGQGLVAGDGITVRWYGLGLMNHPGRVFYITDTGYARRIDGLNIELGDTNGG